MALVCGVLAVQLAAGCERRPDAVQLQAQLDEAERLCLELKFDEARVLLKAYLLKDPENPGAHFYLGRTYLLSVPALAEGEYQTALRLFIRQGSVSPTKRLSPEYFELMCNVDSAKALWLQTGLALATPGAPSAAIRDPLVRAFDYLARARKTNAAAPEIDIVAGLLREAAEEYARRAQ